MRWLLLLLCAASIAHADPIADREREAADLEQRHDFASLARAAELRQVLGQRAQWIATARRAAAVAQTKEEAASVMWSLRGAFEGDALVAHMRTFLRQFGEDGDRGILALATIAQHAWRTSCPIAGIDGLCARFAKPHPRACDQKRARWDAVGRDPLRARPALVQLAEVARRVEQTMSTDPEVRAAHADAKLTLADAQLEVMIARRFPKLSFTTRDARERSNKRFEEFIKAQMKTSQLQQYEGVMGLKIVHAQIAAAYRIGQQTQIFASQFVTSPTPHRLDSGELGQDKRAAYCERMTEVVEPLDMRTIQAFAVCAMKSRELDHYDERSEACMRALVALKPDEFPPDRELVAKPRAVW